MFDYFSILSLLFLSFTVSELVFACQCPPVQKISKEEVDAYDVVYIGKVDSVAPCAGQLSTAYFTVDRLFKGESSQQIEANFDCVTDCRMQFRTGEEWLIYARYAKYGDLRISFCSRSRKYATDVNEDYAIATSGMKYEEEINFLKNTYGERAMTTTQREVIASELTDRELIKPQGVQVIWLLVVSLAVMGLIWFLLKKLGK